MSTISRKYLRNSTTAEFISVANVTVTMANTHRIRQNKIGVNLNRERAIKLNTCEIKNKKTKKQ